MEPRRIVSTRTITDASGTRTVTDFVNTQTRTLDQTTVSTNKDDFAFSTLETTETRYNTGFRFITTIKYEDSTTIQDRFTRTSVLTSLATVTATPSLLVTSLVPQVTLLSTQFTGVRPTTTVVSQLPGSTITRRVPGSITRTLLAFSTSVTTVAPPCTQ